MLWIARDEIESPRPFDGKFLGIQNPYGDDRLRTWSGIMVTRYYDPAGREVGAGTRGAKRRELIPLALYGLDYPKVPLLLVDFRNTHAPKRREMLGRAAADVITGVLGVSRWGNWPYLAGSWGWNFLRARHGTPTNEKKRLDAYSAVRRWLALDHSLDQAVRKDMQRRLEILGVNPLEESVLGENELARMQYAALLKYASDPEGLPARLEKDREAERTGYSHGTWTRSGLMLARLATLGINRHREGAHGTLLTVLDKERRAAREIRFLESVLASSPRPELVWDMDEVRKALDTLAATGVPARSAKAVEKILARPTDAQTRAMLESALDNLHAAAD
jgi:hypothetical protein